MGVWLLRGDDEVLVANALHDLVRQLVGEGDRSLLVDEFVSDDYVLADVVDAAQTPPFLSDRRIVVARNVGRFTADQHSVVVAYLGDPMVSADLVLTNVGGRLPKSLSDALKRAGAVIVDTDPPSRARERQGWFDEHFSAAGLRLEPPAKAAVIAALGEDVGRLAALCDTLAASFDTGQRLSVADVEPFLTEAGSVPPWELTDAVDRGDTAGALERLARLMAAGERHPLQILATLHAHYSRMLRLDGSGVGDEAAAAAHLGIKGSTFPARKALDQGRRLGAGGVRRAVELLAKADLDLRGATDWPPELVVEVLVARLSKLAPAGTSRRR